MDQAVKPQSNLISVNYKILSIREFFRLTRWNAKSEFWILVKCYLEHVVAVAVYPLFPPFTLFLHRCVCAWSYPCLRTLWILSLVGICSRIIIYILRFLSCPFNSCVRSCVYVYIYAVVPQGGPLHADSTLPDLRISRAPSLG